MSLKPCLTCGEPSPESYCEEHYQPARRAQRGPKTTARKTAGDYRWERLSKKARRLQPWCTDCGSEHDLQLDHTEETWDRIERRLPIGLEHTGGVVCGDCNRKRGAPGGRGSLRLQQTPGG